MVRLSIAVSFPPPQHQRRRDTLSVLSRERKLVIPDWPRLELGPFEVRTNHYVHTSSCTGEVRWPHGKRARLRIKRSRFGRFFVFLDKTPFSHLASFHPGRVPANLMFGGNPAMCYLPKGEQKYSKSLHASEGGISCGSNVGHLAQRGPYLHYLSVLLCDFF